MLSLPLLESTGSTFPRMVRKSGVDLEFMQKWTVVGGKTLIDALDVIFGIYRQN